MAPLLTNSLQGTSEHVGAPEATKHVPPPFGITSIRGVRCLSAIKRCPGAPWPAPAPAPHPASSSATASTVGTEESLIHTHYG